jgi:hypothetical protein
MAESAVAPEDRFSGVVILPGKNAGEQEATAE